MSAQATPGSSAQVRKEELARSRALQQADAAQRLSARWGGRRQEVCALVGLLGAEQPAVDLFVYGGTSTGKTSVVK